MEVIMNDPLFVYLLKAFEKLALTNCGVRADSQEPLHSEAKDALLINKWFWMYLNGRCSVQAEVAEDFEFVFNEPSLAVIGGDLADWELLLSASGFLVEKSDMRVGAVAQHLRFGPQLVDLRAVRNSSNGCARHLWEGSKVWKVSPVATPGNPIFLSLKVDVCGVHVVKLIDVSHLRRFRHVAERLVSKRMLVSMFKIRELVSVFVAKPCLKAATPTRTHMPHAQNVP